MRFLSPILFILFPCILFAQLSITIDVQDATCSSNGQITITTSGGSGDYTYSLINDCEQIFPQETGIFSTLPPCDYTVNVTDNDTNEMISEEVTIQGTYQTMDLSISHPDCDIMVNVSGGVSPFIYAYSTNGLSGTFTNNQPPDSGFFSNLNSGTIWFRVTDNCGNTMPIQTTISNSSVDDFTDSQSEDGLHITPQGGNPPYTFELTSSLGTFQNGTGIFPWEEVGCHPRITITDQCSGQALPNQSVDVSVGGTLECVNYSLGTANIIPNPGRAPFVFEAETPSETFTSSDGNFTNLPINAAYYNFYIEDACGERELIRYTTRLQLDFEPTANGCDDDEINFSLDRQCSGPIYPTLITCMNCGDLEAVEVSSTYENIQFSNHLPGEWDILVVDQVCRDSFRCQDSLFLELTPACDSILASVIDKFYCDNNINNRRVIYDTSTVFSIRDENGILLEEGNTTGIFNNLPLGTYEITAFLDCDTLTNTVSLQESTPINPYFETRIHYGNYDGECRYKYAFNLEKLQGPFVISGGEDGSYYEVLNNFGEDNCRFYTFSLAPGTYTIASMSRCGEMTLELPDLPFIDLTDVRVISNCPSGSVIEVDEGLRSAYEWRNLLAPFDLNIQDLTSRDRFKIDNQYYTTNIISGLSPGEHTIYLYPLGNGTCPTDSISFFIPEYSPIALHFTGDILCDNNDLTDLEVTISNGNTPYTLSEIDCTNSSTQLGTYNLDSLEQLTLEGLSLGTYCFVVRDACGVSSDFQKEIRYYEDDIELSYSCDSTIQLEVDSLNIPIFWKNEQNEVIGTGASLSQIAPNSDETFTVELQLPTCSIERDIEIPHRNIFPSLTTSPPNTDTLILCGNETIELTIETDADIINWNTGDSDFSTTVSQTGQYIATVTNDIGCHRSDSINILKVALPTPQIMALPGFCADTFTVLNLNQPFTSILWSNNTTLDSLLIMEGGEYSVEVSNEYGCTQRDSVTITKWALPVFSIEGENTVCPNASIQIQPNTNFESYLWNTGETSSSINVPAGDYQITVTDEHACQNSNIFSIEELPQISAHLQGDTLICEGDEALIHFNLLESNQTSTSIIEIQPGGEQISLQLTPNDTFNLTFDNSASIVIDTVTVEGYNCPIDISGQANITVTNEKSDFEITAISCSGKEDGSIIVSTNSQSPPYQYIWSNGSHDQVLTKLAAGNYHITVTDNIGCTWYDSIFVHEPSILSPSIFANDPLCNDDKNGVLAIDNISGGTPPYTTFLNDSSPVTVPYENSNLTAGIYKISLLDANNCPWDTLINLINPPELTVTLEEDEEIKLGDNITLTPSTNNTEIGIWQWIDISNNIVLDTSSQISVQPFSTTTYQIITKNTFGCTAVDDIIIYVDNNIPIFIPNAFSPNDDGINDYLSIYTHPNITKIRNFQVFDRWGELVFTGDNSMLNNPNEGWDGMHKGKKANTGVYIFALEVELIDGSKRQYSGDVILLR